MLKTSLPLLIVCCALLAGCGTALPTIKPFKMDIQQGNVVTSKMLLQLKPGMTKSQVRFIMGTPLVVDSFHKDRWDYFYQMRQAGKIVEQRRVILDFDKELLTKVRGDVVPQGTLGAAGGGADTGDSNVVTTPITVEPKPKETSMLDKLKFWKKDENPIAKPDVAAAAATDLKEGVAKTDTKPKAEEKSLLDKLKFWKKDEPVVAAEKVAPATPIAALPTEAAAVTTEGAETAVPSVLAVPMLAVPDEAPTAEAPKEEPAMAEPMQTQPLKAELPAPAEAMPMPEKITPKPLNSTPVKELATKSEPKKPLPMSAKQGEPFIFRMDKNLDLNRSDEIKPEVLPAVPVSASDAKPKPSKVDISPLPDEAEPSYFDKLLEKIGF